ncbi:hypothetical protein LUZ63_004375 [Rhynchospora breviuscula]|uniref:Integrase catalytic domain-containing protein n=1 Tax=Rhynchospora breviuscula TaxID=2022672 RepID=A0A9Q0D2C3_9POAL|nr:hypothetical protein LUZ63_004375 [Rhynchospora breviuscula]
MVSEPSMAIDHTQTLNSSSSSSTTTLSSSSLTMESVVLINLSIATKLSDSNYLAWIAQILPIIHGYDLARFIDSPSPNSTRTTTSGQIEINPEFLPWRRQDQLLLGWIRSSLTDSVQAQVVSCTSTKELWDSLQQLYCSTSRARLVDLKCQIQAARKGDEPCAEYLQNLRRAGDELAFIGSPVPDEDLVMAAINGLGVDYNPVVAAVKITSRHAPYSFSDLRGLLLSHEALLKSQSVSHNSAFYAGRGYPRNKFNQNNGTRPPQYQTRPYQYQNNGTRPTGTQSVPAQNTGTQSADSIKPSCQICTKFGHSAKLCYRRYDPNPEWVPNPRRQAYTAQLPSQQSSLPPNASDWVIDSGANSHVTGDLNSLSSFYAYSGNDRLQIGSGKDLPITHIGSTFLNLSNQPVKLCNVLHVPNFSTNLISLSRLLKDNPYLTVDFHLSTCTLKNLHTLKVLHQVHSCNGLYTIQVKQFSVALLSNQVSASTWHARLGHPSSSTTLEIVKSNSLSCNTNKMALCHACAQAKAHVLPFHSSVSVSSAPLELIHSDVWGPSPVTSSQGYRYYVTFVDDYSKFTWIYFLKQKSDVLKMFSLFKAKSENLLSASIKYLRTDGGAEFKPIAHLFPQITHQTSCPHTPQQNGTAERKHRHIIELALAIMSHASIPSKYWDEVFSSTVYLINRLPSHHAVPFTTLFNKAPNYSLLQIIGCLCFLLTRPYNKHKLELRAVPCVFMGYSVTQKGYRCLDLKSNRMYISRNVQFDETVFPFQTYNTVSSQLPSTQTIQTSLPIHSVAHTSPIPTTSAQQQVIPPQPISTTQPITQPPAPFSNGSPDRPPDSNLPLTVTDRADHTSDTSVTPSATPIAPTSSVPPPPTHSMMTRTKDKTRLPRKFNDYVAHLASLPSEPLNFTQASTSPDWRAAMASEISALARNNTWSLVPPQPDQKVIGCKWVYKLKRKADGSIERHKARLVAKGYHQEEGVDYFDTYSPMVRPTTIRVILSLAAVSKWQIKQLDVHNAFLHGDLTEQVFMAQPQGFVDQSHPDYVCLLHKSLYGLKQAPRAWFHKLSTSLTAFGFKPSVYDPSLFILHHNGQCVYVLIYVDDILITGSDNSLVATCVHQLQSNFAIKDLGSLHYFLGIEAQYSDKGYFLTQTKYILDLLSRVNMVNAKPCLTPMATGTSLFAHDGPPLDDAHMYRSVVGALQYATLTRPEISFAVNKVSQFMHAPTTTHWGAVKRILRFLCGTLHHGLHLSSTSSLAINAYSDSDWAGSIDDRKSTSGFCVFLGKNLVSWCAKKQPTVSRSSTEAEYRCLALTCTEIMWLQYLLKELNIHTSQIPTLWCDNIGATFLVSNPMFHARTKHIEIDYHFVRERVASNQLIVQFLCSADQIGDIMTKPLCNPRFEFLRSKLNVVDTTLACGGCNKHITVSQKISEEADSTTT